MADPKGKNPESEHPHNDDLPLDLGPEHEGLPAEGDDVLPESSSVSGSIEEFHFSGPAEELDFTEPADFTFPTQPAGEPEAAHEHSGEFAPVGEFVGAEQAEGEHFFNAEEHGFGETSVAEDAAVGAIVAGEGIPDLEAAEEEIVKPKRELPAWVRTAEWVAVGVLAAGSFLALVITALWMENDPHLVTIILNIACPVMLGLIPYSLWRSSKLWVAPAASALYTVMLAIGTAVLIAGVWFLGMELASYDWYFSKTRVTAHKPRPVVIAAAAVPAQPATVPAGAAK